MNEGAPNNQKEIYAIIAIGIIGFLFAIRRVINNRSRQPTGDITPEVSNLPDNKILEGTNQLPRACKETLRMLDCIITNTSGDKESLNLYRQQISSERNISTKEKLENSCTQQFKYMHSLTGINSLCKSLSTNQ